ncbi:MAG: hypothetical protein GY820_32400, partial [Gammaproteobacteria bacterium]|nr:hypothetical protein [Gammaproteobacteria bacterium]
MFLIKLTITLPAPEFVIFDQNRQIWTIYQLIMVRFWLIAQNAQLDGPDDFTVSTAPIKSVDGSSCV